MVRIIVDEAKCQGYGQCCHEAPGIFQLEEPPVSHPDEVEDSLRDDAERAADACPMQAISVD